MDPNANNSFFFFKVHLDPNSIIFFFSSIDLNPNPNLFQEKKTRFAFGFKSIEENSNFVPRAKFGVFLPAHKFHAEWDNHYFMTRIFTRGAAEGKNRVMK